MSVMIGIDPHKATHTAVAIDNNDEVLDECKLRASRGQARRLCDWAEVLPSESGPWSPRTDLATWWPSSWSRPARSCSMFRRCWRRGCGCSARAAPRKTIRMMPARSRLLRCVQTGPIG